ncbi:MAG TPA: hypothetical protein VHO47_05055 [Candidatus Babeliales bacterium]|nr:hypothetical protein [Candidatus Babeliales bacterium]
MKYIFAAIVLFPTLTHSMDQSSTSAQREDNQTSRIDHSPKQDQIRLNTGSTVSLKTYSEVWEKLKNFGTEDNIQNGLHHDLYAVAEGGRAQSESRAALLKKYGLPTKQSEIPEEAKKIILATKKLVYQKNPGYGCDFIDSVTSEIIHFYTLTALLG